MMMGYEMPRLARVTVSRSHNSTPRLARVTTGGSHTGWALYRWVGLCAMLTLAALVLLSLVS